MRRQTMLLAAVAVLVPLNDATIAQSTPNFSGTWTQVRGATPPPTTRPRSDGGGNSASTGSGGNGRSAGVGGLAFNCSLECTIVQTATTLTIKRPTDATGFTPPDVVLELDGSDSTNTQPGRDGRPPTTYVATAKWEGQTLLVTRPIGSSGQFLSTQTLSLDGGTLKITTGATVPGITPQTLTYTKK